MSSQTERTKKESIFILSDLWGLAAASYMDHYVRRLKAYFHIEIIDLAQLAGVSVAGKNENSIHSEMLSFGIDRAVSELLSKEPPGAILAFSMGGLVAWKAMLQGLSVSRLVAVSTTRLRYEEKSPKSGSIDLFYGGEDPYIQTEYWQKAENITTHTIQGVTHEFYANEAYADQLIKPLIDG